MRDHVLKWPEIPDWSRAVITGSGLRVRAVGPLEQHLVSGDLAAFGRASGLDPQGVGALGQAGGTAYTVRLGRDRLLVVSALDTLATGWNAVGYAVTAVGAALPAFEMAGDRALEVIRRATTLDPAAPGPCATLHFAGVQAVLYRHGDADTFRLHVDRGLATHVWSWLDAALAAMA